MRGNIHLDAANIGGITDEDGNSMFIVAGHGNSRSTKDMSHVGIKASTLASAIKRHPSYTEGQSVFLLSCETGTGNYAQDLADLLGPGTNVYAPSDNVIVSGSSFYVENSGEYLKFVGRRDE